MGPAGMISNRGQLIEVFQEGRSTPIPSKALPPGPGKDQFITCFAGLDIHPGNTIRFLASKMTYTVSGIEPFVMNEQVEALNVYYHTDKKTSTPPTPPPAPNVTHNHHYGHNFQGISNSALQVDSPGANLTANFGADEKALAKEAMRLVLEVIDELNLSADEKEELRADAAATNVQLDSPKPKASRLKSFFHDICEKVQKGISGTVADEVSAKGKRIIEVLKQLGSQAWAYVTQANPA